MSIVQQRIVELPVEGKPLGRHVHHDARSLEYPAETASKIISVDHGGQGLPLDQGQIGSCTANALCAALNSKPNDTGIVRTEQDAVSLYELETKLEGQPYPPNDPGGSGLMVCKAAKGLGWIRSYRHAFGLEHALQALVLRPVIFGVNWYDSFDEPDANGVISLTPGATVRGGHEVCADAIDTVRQMVGLWQSWGPSWGLKGRFWLSYGTLDRLLSEQGDCTVPYV